MYDEQGNKIWDCILNIYGKVTSFKGSSLGDCPFRFQGQYEDEETELYYNRFRYYSPNLGNYVSQDPIEFAGNNPTFYGYVYDTNSGLDLFGLNIVTVYHYTSKNHTIKYLRNHRMCLKLQYLKKETLKVYM